MSRPRTTASSKTIAAVGVDLGGTWLRARALNAQGRTLKSVRLPAPLARELRPTLRKILKGWQPARVPLLAMGSRGVWTPAERKAMAGQLRGLGKRIEVMSDVEAAWRAAFRKGQSGILVVAGTGSIAFAVDRDGCRRRAGGFGPLLGDEGSAFWIGRQWLRVSAPQTDLAEILGHLRKGESPVRHIASLASQVLARANQRDRQAVDILEQAQRHLAELVVELVREMHWPREIPISWAGALLEEAGFRKGFERAVAQVLKKRPIRWVTPGTDAATAAAEAFLSQ